MGIVDNNVKIGVYVKAFVSALNFGARECVNRRVKVNTETDTDRQNAQCVFYVEYTGHGCFSGNGFAVIFNVKGYSEKVIAAKRLYVVRRHIRLGFYAECVVGAFKLAYYFFCKFIVRAEIRFFAGFEELLFPVSVLFEALVLRSSYVVGGEIEKNSRFKINVIGAVSLKPD